MSIEKTPTTRQSSIRMVQPLLQAFALLFYVCKAFGIYPHDLQIFQLHNRLQKSSTGTAVVIAVMIVLFICYGLMLYVFQNMKYFIEQDVLSLIVGTVISYIGLVACFVDQISALRQQDKLGEVFARIHIVDQALKAQGITVSNVRVMWRMRILATMSLVFELLMVITSFWTLSHIFDWAWLCVFSCLPTLYNSFDKTWFVGMLVSLEQRFAVINITLEKLVSQHEQVEQQQPDPNINVLNNQSILMQHFEKELLHKIQKRKVSPFEINKQLRNLPPQNTVKQFGPITPVFSVSSELHNIEQIQDKFTELCQLHSDICDIAKTVNRIWSLPLTCLMAYGFLTITTMLYFLYVSTTNSELPFIFRNTQLLPVTCAYVIYIAGKCTAVMFHSWKTTQECKRMGICLHKCAVAANDNKVYEIVNHLSLKLLHHGVDFSASEFFTLDMKTLFAICGGLTSYLIIFIQFDIAARQVRSANFTMKILTTTENSTFAQF